MKLKSLKTFEVLNEEIINVIVGGGAPGQDSNKKDITSETKDSASNDRFD